MKAKAAYLAMLGDASRDTIVTTVAANREPVATLSIQQRQLPSVPRNGTNRAYTVISMSLQKQVYLNQ